MKASCSNVIKSRKKQSGLAAVEFVIVLLILIPMMVATLEFGRYIYQYNTLTKAVRNGARYVADNALDSARTINLTNNLITETRTIVVYGDITASGAKVLEDFNPNKVFVTAVDVAGLSASISPSHIRVSADYDFEPIFDFIPDNLGITMTASTVQRAI